jgi:hypothetical protein
VGAYAILTLVPKGQEDGLPFPMAEVRHHDRYSFDGLVHFVGE